MVDAWLGSPALDGLEELEFDMGGLYDLSPDPQLPPSALRFSATLRLATFAKSRFECIRINSRSLVSLGLRVYTDELVIEDAPLLERLLQVESRVAMNLSVVSAPKLETVGCLCDLDFYSKLLAPEATVLQELSAVSFGTVVSSVKTLAINIPSLSIGVFVDLMRCFPCLETLYIQRTRICGRMMLSKALTSV
nr:unnamed protein product [Digitaria exilis]